MTNRQKAIVWLDEIDEEGSGLSDWEAEFVDSMLKKIEGDQKYQPTDTEVSKIREIYEDRVLDSDACDGDMDDDWGDR